MKKFFDNGLTTLNNCLKVDIHALLTSELAKLTLMVILMVATLYLIQYANILY